MKMMIIRKSILFSIVLLSFVVTVNAQSTYKKVGLASFYADKFEGRQTANGEIYYHAKKTAAHKTLPFGSIVKVTNLENNKVVVVRINDRGPFVDNRIIDLSKSVAKELDFIAKGITKVKIEVIASTDDLSDETPKTKVYEKSQQSKTYFKLNIDAVSPKGKGVQIASYTNDENVFRLANDLKKKYNEEVFVELATINGKKVCRIIIGNYSSDAKLNVLKNKLKIHYPGCFIVTFK